ncbi:hypothetical protein DB30_02516 [Enhygromyxa salina]|uniref:Pvc16 N-terminal domain-containing protein n=1 Tax=Enhygromyxa salina TaxID=215803 RepID=A0A0C2A3D7_9BACT|nr:hypothetical protein DB30_02516 [Enhygromyxa salina]
MVTTGLMKLLGDNINKNIDSGANVTVTAEPPDKVGSVTNKISLYMYHVAEEAYYKNMEGPGSNPRSIARTPMGLCLFYILTAHHESSEPEFDPLTQQRIMGYALKTIHDYPVLFDSTKIDDETILPSALVGHNNPVQIIMRPTAPEDAIAFWGTEDQQTARLSAYYEVRVMLLEPDAPTNMPAPVLSLGTFLYQMGSPHFECTQSELPFTLPAAAGGGAQLVQASPARVSGDSADPVRNRLELLGHNLLSGQSRQLWLRNQRWTGVAQPDGTGGPVPVDLQIAANGLAGWALTTTDSQLQLDIGKQLTFINELDAPTVLDVFPGIYTAFLSVTLEQRMVGGQLVPITNDSNEVALVVIPRIKNVVQVGTNRLELEIEPTFALDDSDIELSVIVDGQVYVAQALNPVEDLDEAGQFEVDSPTKLTLQALFDTTEAGDHATRIIVNGAESAPFWTELP